jgi:hypothetical protein
MIMATTPVSVVTYAIVAGEVAIATPAKPSIRLLKALWERLTGQNAARPQSQPPIPDTSRRQCAHHRRNDYPAVALALISRGEQQQR